MVDFLSHYIGWLGMPPVSVLTTVFGAFAVTFAVIVCWSRLVKDFGPIGGMMAAGFIIGTFWVLNHKLPGFGIHPEGLPHPDGGIKQFGLIYQGFRGAAPWVDMGTAIGFGLWVCGLAEAPREERMRLAAESLPRIGAAIAGGVLGGVLAGLVGWTGANLFGY
ncbi:MAG: hypothetical protein ABR924_12755 [Terracidiphilus sp.]|jgi:hypothetical protein